MSSAVASRNGGERRLAEERHHRESVASIRLKAQRLKRALDGDRLEEAVRAAADVAAELRSPPAGALSPKAYYDVYLCVCNELRELESYVTESARRGAPVLELYERAQETPLVLPRLYLLVTAGAVYVRSQQAPAKDVMQDLVEMCAGVQHPLRGLFLRAYLSQMMKDKLPDGRLDDEEDEDEDEETKAEKVLSDPLANGVGPPGGNVLDSVRFVLRNFTEMNRLWVRMEHDGTHSGSARSDSSSSIRKDREDLRLLVGSNFSTLGRLSGLDLRLYKREVLPAIVEQIVACEDALAQEYLSDCLAQAFPDEFLLATLDAFLQMCARLVRGANLHTIIVSVLDRLVRYASSSANALKHTRDADAFAAFQRLLPAAFSRQASTLRALDRLYIAHALMRFVLIVHKADIRAADAVLALAVSDGIAKPTLNDEERFKVAGLLEMVLASYRSVKSALELRNFPKLQALLHAKGQRDIAMKLLQEVSDYRPCVPSVDALRKLFLCIRPLVLGRSDWKLVEPRNLSRSDTSDIEPYKVFVPSALSPQYSHFANAVASRATSSLQTPAIAAKEDMANGKEFVDEDLESSPEFVASQELVARVVYLIQGESPSETFGLYRILFEALRAASAQRRAHTLSSLAQAALRLALHVPLSSSSGKGEKEDLQLCTSLLRFASEVSNKAPASTALRVHVQLAVTAAAIDSPDGGLVYDALVRSFELFETSVPGASEQFTTLELIVSSLSRVRHALSGEVYGVLARRCATHAQHLLSRSDQSAMLLLCAGLHVRPGVTSTERSQMVSNIRLATKCALQAPSRAEQFFLLSSIANRMIHLSEAGFKETAADEHGLQKVLAEMRDIVKHRDTKNLPLGRLALQRKAALVSYLRSRPNLFDSLNLTDL